MFEWVYYSWARPWFINFIMTAMLHEHNVALNAAKDVLNSNM